MVDASVEMEAIVQADGPSTPPASVVVGPGGHDIRLTGELQEGVARRLAAVLAVHPEVTRIHLTSEGGLADEGQAIGDVIAAHRLTTFVPDYCVSACTLAFVRGRERLVLDDARLGFHAPFEEGLFGALYRGDGTEQRAAYIAAGLTPTFVDAALKVDPAGIWYPTDQQLIAAHVVTSTIGHYELPDSNLDGTAALDGARALVSRNFPVTNAFLRRAPQIVDKIASWYLDGYMRALSEGENADRLRTAVHSAIAAALARADDATLLDVARFLQRGMSATGDAGTCTSIAAKADLLLAAEQLGSSADSDATRKLLDSALAGQHTLAEAGPATLEQTLATSGDANTDCAGWRQRYLVMLQKPSREAAADMRALVDAQAYRSLVALKR